MNDARFRAGLIAASQAFKEMAEALAPAENAVIPVRRGDNLGSLLETAAPGAVFKLAIDFEWHADLWFDKPVALMCTSELGLSRIDPNFYLPTLFGSYTVDAPDVQFVGIEFHGEEQRRAILATGLRTVVDRCRLSGSQDGQKRGIIANSEGVRVLGSRIVNCWHLDDAQAIYGDNGTKDLRIENCYLEASGENVMFGGGDSSSPEQIPQDIVIQNCTLSKPLAWRGLTDRTIKNAFELKCAKRVLFKGNTIENSWVNGQAGWSIVLSVRNQGGAAPWSVIEDVVIEDNISRNTASGIQILGRDDQVGVVSGRMQRVAFRRNTFELNPAALGGGGRQIYISRGPKDLSFEDTTITGVGLHSAFYFDGRDEQGVVAYPTEGFIVRDHHAPAGLYGVKGDNDGSGAIVLEHFAPGAIWERVTLTPDTP